MCVLSALVCTNLFLLFKGLTCPFQSVLVCSICTAPLPVAVVNTPQFKTNTSVMVSWSPADNPDNGTVTGYQLTVVILGVTDNTTHSNASVDGGSTTTANLTSLGERY